METITLVKQTLVDFFRANQTTEQGFITRRSLHDLKAELPRQFSSTLTGNHDQKNGTLEVKIMLPELILPDSGDAMGSMQIEADEENHVLKKILSMHSPKDVTLTWKVTHFGLSLEPTEQTSWTVEGIEVVSTRRFKPGANGNPSHPRAYLCVQNLQNVPASFIAAWRDGKPFSGFFSIFLTIPKSPFTYKLSIQNEHFFCGRKMLENQLDTDLELISCNNGLSVKCHRAILSVSSVKLTRLLEMQKERQRVDFMSHLSEECIQKLLAYIYYKDVTSFGSSVALAIRVLEAASEFEQLGLTLHIQVFLLKKSANEFSPGESVKCFVVTKSSFLHANEERDKINEKDDATLDNENGMTGTGHETADESENSDNEEDDGDMGEMIKRGVKRINQDNHVQLKRNRVGYKGPRVFDDGVVVAGCSSSTIIINCSGTGSVESDRESQSNRAAIVNQPDDLNVIKMDDVSKYWDLLEKHAIDVILWHLKNNRSELLGSLEYLELVSTPRLLMEVTNIFASNNGP